MRVPSRKAAINQVLGAIERLDPPYTIEFRSRGAFPTIVEITQDAAGGYCLDVGFSMGSEEPPRVRAATPEEAAAVLGSEGGRATRKIPWHDHVKDVYAKAVAIRPDVSDAEVIRKAEGNWPDGLKRPKARRTLERFVSALGNKTPP